MKLVRKISAGGINNVRNGFKNVTERRHVMRVFGIARSATRITSDNMSDSEKFIGEFQATNADGEEYSAAVCYLPEPAQSLLANAVNVEGHSGIEFGFDFFIVPDETSEKGYVFETVPLIENRPSDALTALTAKISKVIEHKVDKAVDKK